MNVAAINEPRAWRRRWWWSMAALVFIGQLALIFTFGAKTPGPVRTVTQAPTLHLVNAADELIALNDPTLFALPHANDFAAAIRKRVPTFPLAAFHWAEPAGWLPLTSSDLLNSLNSFMQTNSFATGTLDFKPPPIFSEPPLKEFLLPTPHSTFFLRGELAQDGLLNGNQLTNDVSTNSWSEANVIAPSRVQVLVDTRGQVVSAVLLPPDYVPDGTTDPEKRDAAADQRALELARLAQFSPNRRIIIGQIVFNWHAVPLVMESTNPPAKTR